MKDFTLAPQMLTLRGEFYPTGFIFAMLPTEEDARQLERQLRAGDFPEPEILFLSPETVLNQIVPTARHHGDTLPSVGTESATTRRYRDLALQGHCAVMVRSNTRDAAKKILEVIHSAPVSIAEKYRLLVIEDLA
jgi:hypothetical protein